MTIPTSIESYFPSVFSAILSCMYDFHVCCMHYIHYVIMSHDYVYTLISYFTFIYVYYIHSLSHKLIIFLFIRFLLGFRRILCRSILVNWGWVTRCITEWLAFCVYLCCLRFYVYIGSVSMYNKTWTVRVLNTYFSNET